MRAVAILLLLVASVTSQAAPRFVAVDVFVTADEPLAAWQFELTDANGVTTVVGIENGSSAAFADAPYYDRAAVEAGTADRIVVADYSLDAAALPTGRVHIATLHLMLDGVPEFNLTLVAATTLEGRPIDASIVLDEP